MEQFNSYFMDVLKNKYAQFSGRAPRREFWYFTLFYIIVYILLGIIEGVLGIGIPFGVHPETGAPMGQIGILSLILSLALLLPSLAISFRRLHDIGKSAWWLLVGLVPIIGGLVLLYFYITPSQEGDNQYGPYPTN